MEFTRVATEQTTAATDVMLALLSMGCMAFLWSVRRVDRWKVSCWILAIGSLAIASLLGAVVHGIRMPPHVRQQLWMPLNVLLITTAVFILTGTIYDRWGRRVAARAAAFIIALATALLLAMIAGIRARLLLPAAEVTGLLFTIGTYLQLTWKKQCPGNLYMLTGMIITLIAGLVETMQITALHFIWQFDANGIFHLVQAPALALITLGVRKSLQGQPIIQ